MYFLCALTFYVFTGLATALTSAVENPGDDPLQWLRDSIPGEPNVDYPIFSAVEQTSFNCDDKVFGGKIFYAITFTVYRTVCNCRVTRKKD